MAEQHPFDRLARSLAQPQSRRALLRRLGVGLAAAAAGSVAPRFGRTLADGPCASGLSLCSGGCKDLQSDPQNCGSCGNALPPGGQCVNGKPAPSYSPQPPPGTITLHQTVPNVDVPQLYDPSRTNNGAPAASSGSSGGTSSAGARTACTSDAQCAQQISPCYVCSPAGACVLKCPGLCCDQSTGFCGASCINPCETCNSSGICVSCQHANMCCAGKTCVDPLSCPGGGCCTDGVCGCPDAQVCTGNPPTCQDNPTPCPPCQIRVEGQQGCVTCGQVGGTLGAMCCLGNTCVPCSQCPCGHELGANQGCITCQSNEHCDPATTTCQPNTPGACVVGAGGVTSCPNNQCCQCTSRAPITGECLAGTCAGISKCMTSDPTTGICGSCADFGLVCETDGTCVQACAACEEPLSGVCQPCALHNHCCNTAGICVSQNQCPDGCCQNGVCGCPAGQTCDPTTLTCQGCDATSCSGCCLNGKCQKDGASNSAACGINGVVCTACTADQTCVNGDCLCLPTTCPNGCCTGSQNGTCVQLAQQTNNQCGVPGSTCAPCADGQRCLNGQCICDGQSCPNGCCIGTTCLPSMDAHCGIKGAVCVLCGDSQTCDATGTCVCKAGSVCGNNCCADNQTCLPDQTCGCTAAFCASGCCAGDFCLAGTDVNGCGTGGATCQICGSNQVCVSQHCTCTPGSCPGGCCQGDSCILFAQQSNSVCGAGSVCAPCLPGQHCLNGVCVCDATSCSGCCDVLGHCQAGTSIVTCGTGGVACKTCDPTAQVCFQGDCVCLSNSALSCGSNCCPVNQADGGSSTCLDPVNGICGCDAAHCPNGCCQNGLCYPNSNDFCGTAGGTCQQCTANQECVNGQCICDAKTCPSGCCGPDLVNGACMPGDTVAFCGTNGLVCQQCGSDQSCATSGTYAGSCVCTATGAPPVSGQCGCPPGQILVNGKCSAFCAVDCSGTACPAGTTCGGDGDLGTACFCGFEGTGGPFCGLNQDGSMNCCAGFEVCLDGQCVECPAGSIGILGNTCILPGEEMCGLVVCSAGEICIDPQTCTCSE